MKFEVDKEVIQDMIAIYGRDQAIDELVAGYKAALETIVEEIAESKN